MPDPEAFIARWRDREGGQERANHQLFIVELCDLLELPHPDPAGATHTRNDYVFERVVPLRHEEGETLGRIDLYRRGAFVLEAKQSRLKGGGKALPDASAGQDDLFSARADRGRRGAGRAWDVLMLNARRQAIDYARALPASHGWPPFVLVCDVGHCIEVFSDFTGQGKHYTQFPDRQGFRIYLEDLRQPEIRHRLRRIWLDPQGLDPVRVRAGVTRSIAERLAAVSRALEARRHAPEEVAMFLMRCLFTMFSESVGLLPEGSFSGLLGEASRSPSAFPALLGDLWRSMNEGSAFAVSIRAAVLRFNGNLFREARVLPLRQEEIGEVAAAAAKDWREVEPAIFGTLLEQALDPKERRRLGAHYTPRIYVERLVAATVMEPLREDWRNVEAAAETRRAAGDRPGAAAEVRAFHDRLCATRVLDPACGTANFLYVALELMKRLEAEVLEALVDLGGQEALRGLGSHTVDPHQFLGIEKNGRAAVIAELVLWIGYLQWHLRTRGGVPDEPILRAFRNIEARDAVLDWDGAPDLAVRDRREAYPNPRRPAWPAAEFIVGNPPFIGGKDLRTRLGAPYTEALWAAHPHINESADLVAYWWDRAAELLTAKGTALRRFGLVTTNSITQEFSRRVVRRRLEGKTPLSLVLAVPDHPWTKAAPDAAAVRIAMTVVEAGAREGVLREVASEAGLDTDEPTLVFRERVGRINADLSLGADVTAAVALRANDALCSPGVKLHGAGFILSRGEAAHLGLGRRPGLEAYVRPYRNGRDLTAHPRDALVIDLFGLDAASVRQRFPEVYQHLLATVKPEREAQALRSSTRDARDYAEKWWLFGKPRQELRPALAGLSRYIATVETAKHRVFQFLPAEIVPDNMLVCVASDDALHLGVLSARPHLVWALRAGGWLGMGNDPRYSKSRVFDPFPFPAPDRALAAEIRICAEELDALRKERRALHPEITLTQTYNVLEAVRSGRPLAAEEESIRDRGLVLILRELHERLDRLVLAAYGWSQDLSDEALLERLVALNQERAAEERRGQVRWLRPDHQAVRLARPADRQAASEAGAQVEAALGGAQRPKPLFPAGAVEQTAAVFDALIAAPGPLDAARIAAGFRQGRRVEGRVAATLAALARLGHLSTPDGRSFVLRRAA